MKTLILPFERKSTAAPAESKRATAAFSIKADSVQETDGARTFSGLASTWDLDLGGDVIRKGAFKRTLQNWKASKSPLPLLDSHNAWSTVLAVIGKLEDAAETSEGLEATFSVMDGPQGDEVWRRIKGGFVSGLSIGYRAMKQEAPSEEEAARGVFRILTEVKLEEISVCVWPMNPNARVDSGSMKSLLDGMTEEQKEEIRALLEPVKPADTAPAPYGKQDALALRIRLLGLRRPGTRASA